MKLSADFRVDRLVNNVWQSHCHAYTLADAKQDGGRLVRAGAVPYRLRIVNVLTLEAWRGAPLPEGVKPSKARCMSWVQDKPAPLASNATKPAKVQNVA